MVDTNNEQKRIYDTMAMYDPTSEEYRSLAVNLNLLQRSEIEKGKNDALLKKELIDDICDIATVALKMAGVIGIMFVNCRFGLIEPKSLSWLK